MLDRDRRLTSSAGFTTATRRGRRAGSPTLVVHVHEAVHGAGDGAGDDGDGPRIGFVVGKAVGNAVTRNRVRRRLRHLVRERLAGLPASALVVVRALPASAAASYRTLGRDLDAALARLLRPAAAGTERGRSSS